MAVRKRHKTKKDKPISKDSEKENSKTSPTEENESSFNYGGLPQRNLKKNLGCG